MSNQQGNSGATHTTLRQQLLRSHLRVAGLAAVALLLAAVALQLLREPINMIRLVNVPSANAAMTVQLGLQRSESNLRGWVALKNLPLRDNIELAWSDEIWPAFELLGKLSSNHNSEQRREILSSLDTKLSRLKKLQDWTIAVSAKDGNEPARLVFSQEFAPMREQLVGAIDQFRQLQNHRAALSLESYFQLRLSLSEAESALGRFVVEGYEADAADYDRHIEHVRTLLESYVFEFGRDLLQQFDIIQRLSDSIIESRRSPRSNVAWHTISTRIAPLSAEIANELALIADHEVSAMRSRVEQIAMWTNALSLCSILVLIVLVVIALVLARAEAKRISAPVTQLFRATEALKNGDYEQTLKPEGVREVRGLISAFNAMRDSISRSHRELEEMAFTDELTGLANRKAFNNSIAAMNSNAQSAHPLTGVLIIDLDYFKQVNDSLGHDAGDQLLSVFANRLRDSLQPGDDAARIGGDEFAVLLRSLSKAEDAVQIIEKITAATSLPITYQGEKILPSATIGAAIESSPGLDAAELVKKADLALYDAKSKGRGSYCIYSSGMHKKAVNVQRLTELVEHNDPDSMFRLVYQPYVELTTGNVVGVEALLRCVHSEYIDVPIIDIVKMLERNGHISGISQWVMKEATGQLAEWQNTLHLPSDFTMSVNVSAALLRDSGFVQSILEIVDASDVAGNSLTIELTETTVMEDYTRSKDAMRRLNDVGIEFAMDDFGTGYSSLVRLREMPLSLLKVDQTFVKGMLSSANDAAIVDASVRLGRAMGMSVTAEGIETAAQAEALRELGCERGQGYYFSYPRLPEELDLAMMSQRRVA